jgi:hypothetical protein
VPASGHRHDGRRGPAIGPAALVVAAALTVAGVVLLVVGLRAQVSAPQAHDVGRISAVPAHGGSKGSPAPGSGAHEAPPLPPSRPVRLRIPALGVDTPVNPIGLAADGSLAVPAPGPHLDEAAWFRNSPTPGQPGPSIIEGHVDSPRGPSVFFRLGSIRPGDQVLVTRADGRRLTFRVDAVRDFPKSRFPTRLVYGSDLARPTLRLITCSEYDPGIRHHVGNAVVFAHLTHASPPSSGP